MKKVQLTTALIIAGLIFTAKANAHPEYSYHSHGGRRSHDERVYFKFKTTVFVLDHILNDHHYHHHKPRRYKKICHREGRHQGRGGHGRHDERDW